MSAGNARIAVLGALACVVLALSSRGRASVGDATAGQRVDDGPAPAGAITRDDFVLSGGGRKAGCNVYLPAGYPGDGTGRYTVIFLLHGRGDSLEAWLAITRDLDRLIAAKRIPPVVAVLPDSPSSRRAGYYVDSLYTGGAGDANLPPGEKAESAITKDLIAHVDGRYRTKAERSGRIIGGYSMGGYGAMRLALAYPELFRAAIVLSPAVYHPLPPRASSAREFGAFGRGPEPFDASVYRDRNYPALLRPFPEKRLPLEVFIVVGDDEYVHPDEDERSHDLDLEAHALYNRLRREPLISAQLRVLDGGHDWEVWRPGFVAAVCHLLGGKTGNGLD